MWKSKKILGVMVLGIFITAGFVLGGHCTEASAETINLTYGGMWPPNHPMSEAVKLWIKRIETQTNGRVKIKAFWAGALYGPKNSAMELAGGAADIGGFSGAYAATGYDFEKSMRMAFWGVTDRKLIRKVYYELQAKYPELTAEFTNAGIKPMAYATIPPYQLILSNRRVEKASDFKGLTIKASGDLAAVAAGLGAEGIVMPMSEVYTALQKSTIDGAFVPFETLKFFRFGEVIKYALELDLAPAPAGHWGFCLKSWKKLPPDIQKVFEDNVDWFGRKVEELEFGAVDAGIQFAKDNGVVFLKLPDTELEKVYTVVNDVESEKMAQLDAKGLPGTKVYKDLRRLVKKYEDK